MAKKVWSALVALVILTAACGPSNVVVRAKDLRVSTVTPHPPTAAVAPAVRFETATPAAPGPMVWARCWLPAYACDIGRIREWAGPSFPAGMGVDIRWGVEEGWYVETTPLAGTVLYVVVDDTQLPEKGLARLEGFLREFFEESGLPQPAVPFP